MVGSSKNKLVGQPAVVAQRCLERTRREQNTSKVEGFSGVSLNGSLQALSIDFSQKLILYRMWKKTSKVCCCFIVPET